MANPIVVDDLVRFQPSVLDVQIEAVEGGKGGEEVLQHADGVLLGEKMK
jgi:hypothetical protein